VKVMKPEVGVGVSVGRCEDEELSLWAA
jgi:hypothetical protein